MGASVTLPRLIGQERATHLLLSGELFEGSDAVKYGLALEAVSKVYL
jgi:enoyl-CoA hydratase/carnithine racemase